MIRTLSTLALVALGAALLPSCSGGFDPATKIQSVRVLGLKADKPYAKPGDTVNLEILAVDRRPKQEREMRVYWVPLVCTNPPNDAYYACFVPGTQLTDPQGAPLGAGSGGGLTPGGGDVTSLLPKGNTFTYVVPSNAVSSHKVVPGSTGPYGISIVFYLACAGRVRFATRDEASANPQQVPLLCTDDDGKPLGADDYVLGFWRTFAYEDRPNTNPVIEGVRVNGEVADVTKPITITACADPKAKDCTPVKVDVLVPPSSQEPKAYDSDAPRERVWVSAFSDVGDVGSATRLLYDTKAGAITDNPIELRGDFDDVGKSGTVWLVVHDNRSGAAWTSLPVTVVPKP
jgi:hypothetical protein